MYPMTKPIKHLSDMLEKRGFTVSERLSKFLGLRTDRVRVFFIYFNFFSLGVAFVLYIWIALLFLIKDTFWVKRKSSFDL